WGMDGGDQEIPTIGGVSVDDAGHVYVVDETSNMNVQKLSTDGEFVTKWGGPGSGDGQFDYPHGIASSASEVYVADYTNRIQRFSASGALISTIGEVWSNEVVGVPVAIALHNALIYVIDQDSKKIKVLTYGATGITGRVVNHWSVDNEAQGMCLLSYPASLKTHPDLLGALIRNEIVATGYAETDDRGEFAILLPPNTEHVLHTWDCDGGEWAFDWYDGHGDLANADTIRVADEGATPIDTIELVEGSEIGGWVTNESGEFIQGVEIWVTDPSGYFLHWYGETDSDGFYADVGLRPDTPHKVEFWDPGETYRWEWFDDKPSIAMADDVRIPNPHDPVRLDAELGPWYDGWFLDDDDSVFEADIEWMAAEGITRGCNPRDGNTKFCPDSYVTRGQMAAFLVRALSLTERLDDPFIDDDDSIFEADIEKLAAAGITRGCNPQEGNTKFCPDNRVTRGQMAAFLVRAMGYTDDGGGDLFTDDDGSIFEHNIDCLGTAGVTRGCNPGDGNTKFCPDRYVTRGQMAAFLHRALG
ncbi:MAG: hypothetical protein ACR2N7_06905, partial [Acidimicrobiia bacterium]